MKEIFEFYRQHKLWVSLLAVGVGICFIYTIWHLIGAALGHLLG